MRACIEIKEETRDETHNLYIREAELTWIGTTVSAATPSQQGGRY